MKPHLVLISAALAAFPIATVAAGIADAAEVMDYRGRLVLAGQPFTGKGNFKFVLLQKDGTRLWTSGDNQASIEEGIPSGSVTLSVNDGTYQVRLGDPSLGMKPLPKASGPYRQLSQIGVWFDDGTHGWSFLGYSDLASAGGRHVATAGADAPATDTVSVLAELRELRTEVGEIRRQLEGTKPRPASAVSSTPPQVAPRVQAQPVPVAVTLKEVTRHSLGRADAPLVLVEFTDYECGFCKRFFEQTFPLLKRDYIDTGKLRFVSRNMPVASHPRAEPAALALLSTSERVDTNYWTMRARLFANQRDLSPATLSRFAGEAGMDGATVLADVAAKKHVEEIQEDLAAAQSVGITGTPSFVLGTSDGQIIRGEKITGAKAFPYLDNKLRALLAKSAAPQAPGQPKL